MSIWALQGSIIHEPCKSHEFLSLTFKNLIIYTVRESNEMFPFSYKNILSYPIENFKIVCCPFSVVVTSGVQTPDKTGVVDLSEVAEKTTFIIVTSSRLILVENLNFFFLHACKSLLVKLIYVHHQPSTIKIIK